MTTSCIFCKIVAGEIPSTTVHKDERVTAFRDLNPVGPTHVLIVPNKHIASVNEATPDDEALLGHLFIIARKVAEMESITENGYRLIVNTGEHGGQTVHHLHMHVIGGQKMKHPMG
jgi:histidine triad (HIT) family protein